MAAFEVLEVEGVAADGRRVRARAVLEPDDDAMRVAEALQDWVDDQLRRWVQRSAGVVVSTDPGQALTKRNRILRVAHSLFDD